MTIRVLLVDDSAVIRGLLNQALTKDLDIEVIGSAANGEIAINTARREQPDIMILDIEMPVMDGITALPKLIEAAPDCKIIMASTLTQRNAEISIRALGLGAADYLAKPSAKFGSEVDEFYRELIEKIHALSNVPLKVAQVKAVTVAPPAPPVESPPVVKPSTRPIEQVGVKAIALASSTGGPQALMTLFGQLKGQLLHLPIFITQHMPATFTAILADHLSHAGDRPVIEGLDGTLVQPGYVYIAPGGYHMQPVLKKGKVMIETNQNPPENFCRPSADPMLRSLSKVYGEHLLTIVLTGMGHDGLEGAKHVAAAGGHVIAQDEATSVVYGMPKAVAENKLCRDILPLPEIGPYLIQKIGGR